MIARRDIHPLFLFLHTAPLSFSCVLAQEQEQSNTSYILANEHFIFTIIRKQMINKAYFSIFLRPLKHYTEKMRILASFKHFPRKRTSAAFFPFFPFAFTPNRCYEKSTFKRDEKRGETPPPLCWHRAHTRKSSFLCNLLRHHKEKKTPPIDCSTDFFPRSKFFQAWQKNPLCRAVFWRQKNRASAEKHTLVFALCLSCGGEKTTDDDEFFFSRS